MFKLGNSTQLRLSETRLNRSPSPGRTEHPDKHHKQMKKILSIILLCVGITGIPSGTANAQTMCSALILQNATRAYEFGRFHSTFELLNPCLATGFSARTDRTDAYRLVALSYLATDSLAQARTTLRQLLRYNSRFRSNPATDPVLFTQMVDDLKPTWYSWLWKGNSWKSWTGRTVVVATIVAIPILLQNDPVPNLPLPPAFPN